MSAPTRTIDLVARAEDDYAIAVSALRRKKPLTYPCAFHSQQCAEKYLKALLAARHYKYSLAHDLVKLNDECNTAGIFTGFRNADLAILSGYAVQVRYAGNEPTLDEAREGLALAKEIRRFARKFLGIK